MKEETTNAILINFVIYVIYYKNFVICELKSAYFFNTGERMKKSMTSLL